MRAVTILPLNYRDNKRRIVVHKTSCAVCSNRQYVCSLLFLLFTEYYGHQPRQICPHLQKPGSFIVLTLFHGFYHNIEGWAVTFEIFKCLFAEVHWFIYKAKSFTNLCWTVGILFRSASAPSLWMEPIQVSTESEKSNFVRKTAACIHTHPAWLLFHCPTKVYSQ